MKNTEALEQLVDALRCLPGIGPKSALRMAYHLLQHNRKGASQLSSAIAKEVICSLCSSKDRDPSILCVIEMPSDLMMLEQTHSYNGMYFILMGKLSPLDGIGPKDIHLDRLLKRLDAGIVKEVILANNFTVSGDATAHYVTELLKARGIRLSRIARGLPMGGEIEYVDSGTLAQAMIERKIIKD
jgi:recombination protein RecR